jgi:hypothetical protein
MVCPLLPAHCRNYSSGKSQLEVLLSSRLGNLPEHPKHAMAHDHAWRQNILIDRADVAIDLRGTKLLDRFACFVHIVNSSIIYPYNSWIYKVNETFSSSANSTGMAGPLSALLPPNLESRSA